MTAPRDTDRLINAFLDEGLTELPDRAFDVVRGEIHQTRQRVVIGPWRQPIMSNFVRVAFAAAVVGAFALAWVNFGPQPGIGTGPTPSPSQSAAPSAPRPDPVSLCSPCVAGPLEAGTYTFNAGTFTLPQMTFTVPAGWDIDDDGFITKHAGAADEVFFAPWHVTHIFPDACLHEDSTVISAGTTPAELASLLAAQKSRVASATTDVRISGLPAKRLELTVPADLDVATCESDSVRPWPDAGPNLGGGYCCLAAGSVEDLSIVEVMGDLIVIIARHEPESSAADQAELDSIVDSLVIDHPVPSLSTSDESAAP